MLLGTGSIREEIKEQGNIIIKQLNNIKNDIPYQSELERDKNKLLDSNVKLQKQVEKLSRTLLSLQETNKKLIEYIENIEEVKQSGGIETKIYEDINHSNYFSRVKYEIKEIPAIKICRVINEGDDE